MAIKFSKRRVKHSPAEKRDMPEKPVKLSDFGKTTMRRIARVFEKYMVSKEQEKHCQKVIEGSKSEIKEALRAYGEKDESGYTLEVDGIEAKLSEFNSEYPAPDALDQIEAALGPEAREECTKYVFDRDAFDQMFVRGEVPDSLYKNVICLKPSERLMVQRAKKR